MVVTEQKIEETINFRNLTWDDNPLIPSWVDINSVGLDQFFTKDDVAHQCYLSMLNTLSNLNVDISEYTFVEPSVGRGAFFKLLPAQKIGLDVMPIVDGVLKQDFLSWTPEQKKKLIFIGNPPFGYRGWLALSFMNHIANFADYVGFILPMSFQSDGKGSPKNRVKGMTLLHSEVIPPDSFITVDGKIRKVNALWQIWKKGAGQVKQKNTCSQWLDLFTVDMRKERLCGQEKLNYADYFLQRTYYRTPPKLVKNFSEVKYVCGYGLIIKKDKQSIVEILNAVNWDKYSNLAAHNCRHISMYHIEKVLVDNGFVDA